MATTEIEIPEKYLTIKQACVYTKLSEMTLARAEREGRLKFLRPVRRRVFVTKEDLYAFMRSEPGK
jgi:excisionase family DNA binding protein